MLHDIDIGEFRNSTNYTPLSVLQSTEEEIATSVALSWMYDILGALNRSREDLRMATFRSEEEAVKKKLAGSTLKKDILELWVKASYLSGEVAAMVEMLKSAEGVEK